MDDEGQDYISDEEEYLASQEALPEHKRDGWLERILERNEFERMWKKENA